VELGASFYPFVQKETNGTHLELTALARHLFNNNRGIGFAQGGQLLEQILFLVQDSANLGGAAVEHLGQTVSRNIGLLIVTDHGNLLVES